MKRLWLFAMAAMWCGCQSSPPPAQVERNSGPANAPPASAPAPPDARPLIACLGDSLTAGYGLDPGQSYPDILQKEIDRRGKRYRVANFGISGDTSLDGVQRLSLVTAEKPAIVVLELGANDGLRGQPIAATEANLAHIIEALRQAGARVVLAGITLPPNYGPDYIRRFEAVYRDLAAKYKLPLIPFLLEGVAGNERLMQRDGLHPTAEGARIVAETVMRKLEPLL
jgi:acyl-CoA thioesterase I